MDALWKGTAIGLAIAAPVGPIGVLCIRRSVADGRLAGFVTGMGASTADTVYGAVAAFGVTALIDWFTRFHATFQLLGGLFLLYLGVSMIRAKTVVREPSQPVSTPNLFVAYVSALALTLANPLTIAAFTGIFAGLGLGQPTHAHGGALRLVVGVLLGSSLWWLFLSAVAGSIGTRLNERGLKRINLIAGLLVLAVALWQLASLAVEWA